LGSLTEFHPYITASANPKRVRSRPFRGFLPFSVLPATQSHLTPAGPNPTGCVAPSGFHTLSTPCSLRGLLGLFHPSSARGLRPSRCFSPRDAVRPFGRRDPHDLCPIRKQAGPSGFHARLAELPVDLGFSQVAPTDTSMGFSPPRFLVIRSYGPCGDHLPSRASSLESQAGPKKLHHRVSHRRQSGLSLSRSTNPLEVSHLVTLLDSLDARRAGVIFFPLRPVCVAVTRRPVFALSSTSGRSSSSRPYR
jgi:hypothetical protein